MTAEIKTPRTEKLVWWCEAEKCYVIFREDARQLERDLALVTQERDALRKKLEAILAMKTEGKS